MQVFRILSELNQNTMKFYHRITLIILLTCTILIAIISQALHSKPRSNYTYTIGYVTQASYDENDTLCMQSFINQVTSSDFQTSLDIDQPVTVITGDSDGSVEKEISCVEMMINANVDAIFMFGIEPNGDSVAIQECNKANIPVFLIASSAESGEYKVIGFDEYNFGVMQAEYLIKTLDFGSTICYIKGVPGRYPVIQREAGFMDTIKQREDLIILDNQVGNFNKEDAMQLTENWIQTYGNDIDCIVSQDNTMAAAAIDVLRSAGLSDHVNVIGKISIGTWDAQLVQQGDMDFAIYVDFSALGELCANVCQKYYLGEPIEDYTELAINNVTVNSYHKYFN